MRSLLTHTDVPLWNLCFRAAAVFVALLVMLRLTNKRQVAQLGLPDFVVVLIPPRSGPLKWARPFRAA